MPLIFLLEIEPFSFWQFVNRQRVLNGHSIFLGSHIGLMVADRILYEMLEPSRGNESADFK
jgi:hypothetical protein